MTLQDMTPLEEQERLRAEFLAMVSHELRTPLTSIKGAAATLTEAMSDLDPAEMLQFFRIIGEQADHMRDLIGDLLDVARIEARTFVARYRGVWSGLQNSVQEPRHMSDPHRCCIVGR